MPSEAPPDQPGRRARDSASELLLVEVGTLLNQLPAIVYVADIEAAGTT